MGKIFIELNMSRTNKLIPQIIERYKKRLQSKRPFIVKNSICKNTPFVVIFFISQIF